MLSEADARAIVKEPFGQVLLETAASYIAPLYWISQDDKGERKISNGTIFFLDCGEGPFAITAAHVYSGYIDQKQKSKIILCRILDEDFNLEENIIDSNVDENVDIATFKISSEIIKKMKKNILTPKISTSEGDISLWPPPPPERDKGVFFAGLPGQARIAEEVKASNTTILNFGIYTALLTATNVDEQSISCRFTVDKIDTFGLGLPESGYNLGGISGAPLLTLYENAAANGLIYWSLGGVIRQAISDWEILYATRADFILPNGKVKKTEKKF